MATELASAYVQIVPSADGLKQALTEMLGDEMPSGEDSGKSWGTSLISGIKNVIAAAGIGAALKAAISEGADLEQSLGGVETLFGDAADTVIANAQNAYQTAGLSANEYMETVTSFSASLLQSLGGDTAAAADIADMALTDMSDNANKMGTDMESIQNAYQGFAKQNYTMLDNLKLGYGGTKEEMERLLEDAQEISGVEYDIDNLSDVYNAIHVIQTEMGITGTTSLEAASTISGSFASVQAAAQNVLGYLTTGMDVEPAIQQLVQTGTTFLFQNLLPALGNIISALPGGLSTFLSAAAEQIFQLIGVDAESGLLDTVFALSDKLYLAITEQLPAMVEQGAQTVGSFAAGILENMDTALEVVSTLIYEMVDALLTAAPQVLESGVQLVSSLATGLLENLPSVVKSVGFLASGLISHLMEAAPELTEKGFTLIANLAQGLLNNLPSIVTAIGQVIAKLIYTVTSHLPEFLQTGITLLEKLLAGIIEAIPQIPGKILEVRKSIINAFKSYDWGSIGKSIIDGIASGIKNFASSIVTAAKNAASSALSSVKSLLGIHSPSKVFRDDVGKNIALGVADGILGSTDEVSSALNAINQIPSPSAVRSDWSQKSTGSESASGSGQSSGSGQDQTIVVQLTLDGRVIGEQAVAHINREANRTGVHPVLSGV